MCKFNEAGMLIISLSFVPWSRVRMVILMFQHRCQTCGLVGCAEVGGWNVLPKLVVAAAGIAWKKTMDEDKCGSREARGNLYDGPLH